MKADTLILGLAAGYHYGDMRPFLASLDESGHSGQCVLFVSETTRGLEQVRAHGTTVIPLNRPAGLDHLPYNALRYFLYKNYLETTAHRFGRILITDVRDVVFQAAPFSYDWPGGINCMLEDPSAVIGGCPHNARWISGHQGEAALARVADRRVSCSGTTVADHDGMVRYLDAMTRRLLPFTPGPAMAGYDQGVHNVLIHTDPLPGLTLHDNGFPVLTLGATHGEPATDAHGLVLDGQGRRPVLIHQYDRKPSLFARIRARLAPRRA
jgi:hypothetical protein